MNQIHEKRRQSRAKLKGYIADIADGHFVYDGIVEDISLEGLRLNDLPDRFIVEKRKYNLVVSGGPDSVCYKLTVYPRWKKKKPFSIDIGFHITNAPAGWKSFVLQMMPNKEEDTHEEDIWDQYNGSSIG